jgi:hypothetical protein
MQLWKIAKDERDREVWEKKNLPEKFSSEDVDAPLWEVI